MANCTCGFQNRPGASFCRGCGARLGGGGGGGGAPSGGGGAPATELQGDGGRLGPVHVGGAVAQPTRPRAPGQWSPAQPGRATPRTIIEEEAVKPLAGWLVVLRSHEVPAYHDVPIFVGKNEIGRNPGPQQIADGRASGQHAILIARNGEVVLTDLSTNGTLINNQQITTQALRHGDRVRIGGTTLVFVAYPGWAEGVAA